MAQLRCSAESNVFMWKESKWSQWNLTISRVSPNEVQSGIHKQVWGTDITADVRMSKFHNSSDTRFTYKKKWIIDGRVNRRIHWRISNIWWMEGWMNVWVEDSMDDNYKNRCTYLRLWWMNGYINAYIQYEKLE